MNTNKLLRKQSILLLIYDLIVAVLSCLLIFYFYLHKTRIINKDVENKELGLRPGEKLYEELLINSDTLTKTSDKLIFIDKDDPLTLEDLNTNLNKLKEACNQKDDTKAKELLQEVVPTFSVKG